jgi:hypothetical protein
MNDVIYLFVFGTIVLIFTELVMIIAESIDSEGVAEHDLPRSIQKGI